MNGPRKKECYRMAGGLRSVASQIQAVIHLIELDAMADYWRRDGADELITAEEMENTLKDCVVKLQLMRRAVVSYQVSCGSADG